MFLGCVLRAERGWSGDLMIADDQDLQIQKPRSIRKRRILNSVCKRNSEIFSIVQDRQRETSSQKMFFIDRHHEEPRLKYYDPLTETFPIPLRYVDVMRQTQTSINNVSEQIINDLWTEAKGVTLSDECTRKIQFQIFRTGVLEGHKWVNGRLSKIQQTTRPESIWPWSLDEGFQETRGKVNCRVGRRKCQTASSMPQRRNLQSIDRRRRLLQGDCWRSSATGKRYCSCSAVHWEGWQPRRSSGSCNPNWRQWGTVRFRNYRSMRQSEATYGPHRRKMVCGKLSLWPGTQASFYSRSCEGTRSQSRHKE